MRMETITSERGPSFNHPSHRTGTAISPPPGVAGRPSRRRSSRSVRAGLPARSGSRSPGSAAVTIP
jgi:hypothetical protein